MGCRIEEGLSTTDHYLDDFIFSGNDLADKNVPTGNPRVGHSIGRR